MAQGYAVKTLPAAAMNRSKKQKRFKVIVTAMDRYADFERHYTLSYTCFSLRPSFVKHTHSATLLSCAVFTPSPVSVMRPARCDGRSGIPVFFGDQDASFRLHDKVGRHDLHVIFVKDILNVAEQRIARDGQRLPG